MMENKLIKAVKMAKKLKRLMKSKEDKKIQKAYILGLICALRLLRNFER
jgi:ribosomal protein L18